MTPNFALDLSEDGIVLLHRSPNGDGWFREGRVDFATDDIAEGLAKLRAKAVELEGEDFATKMVLPASQLLFTTVSEGTDIPHALSERTPYRADQLSYASSGSGDQIRVVAVALETLGEAEGFISPHRLNPVGFTAIPPEGKFDGEPMLGGTLMGADGFDPDPTPIKIIEKPSFLPKPVAPVAEDETEAPEPDAAPEPQPEQEPAATEPETPTAEPDKAGAKADTPADTSIDEDASDPAPPSPAIAAADAEIEAAVTEGADAETAPEDSPAPAAFSSRRQSTSDATTEETGSRVGKLAARIAVPDSAPKLGGAPAKTAPPAPKVKSVAQPKPAPKAVPVVPPAASRMKTIPPSAVAAELAKVDPIAQLAAKEKRGKPRFLGLILTAILLVCLGLAALLSSYVLPENAVSRFLGLSSETEVADNITEPALIEGIEADLTIEEEIELANLPMDQTLPDLTGQTDFTTAEPDVLPERPEPISEAEAEVAYAATGIWQHTNTLNLGTATRSSLDDLYIASLDPSPEFEDAPALTQQITGGGEVDLVAFTPPPPPGVIFDIDERGLVVATPEGALSPEGVMVFQGAPPVRPGRRPEGVGVATAVEEPESRLAGIRPLQRPDDLIERRERATLGGLSRPELAGIRPVQRPESIQQRAEAIARALAEAEAATQQEAEEALTAPTKLAVATSRRAPAKPRNFARIVSKAREKPAEARQAAVQTASASTASPSRGSGPAVARSSRAKPTGRVSATVARAATDNNAISLGRVALVGVFGTSSRRSALVRMPNGRFKKVGIGDRVDGGRVAAINNNSLRYTKGGRTVTLEMPKG